MRRKARVDANHGEVVRALRSAGALVLDLSRQGGGCPDLLVCVRGRLWLLEVKDGTKASSARALTPAEADFAALWPTTVVTSPEGALAAVGLEVLVEPRSGSLRDVGFLPAPQPGTRGFF